MKKTKKTFQPEFLEDWPAKYYEFDDAYLREQCLKEYLKANPDSPEDLRRLEIFEHRYGKGPRHQDGYYYAWSMLKALSQSSTFLNRSRREKDLRQHMIELAVLSAKCDDLQMQEWKNFADGFIRYSLQGHSYGSSLLGLGHVSAHDKAQRSANDIQTVTVDMPHEICLEKEAAPLCSLLEEALIRMSEDGREIVAAVRRASSR